MTEEEREAAQEKAREAMKVAVEEERERAKVRFVPRKLGSLPVGIGGTAGSFTLSLEIGQTQN